jgi:peptidoglycan/xylan/chitin deacetylase (PgdA/CDA1 family)
MMKSRCTNPNHPSWPRYGGRGVEFRFADVETAAAWIAENLGLHAELEIDRIQNDGHYEPGNLRYATRRENNLNRSNTKLDPAWVFNPTDWPYGEKHVRKLLYAGFDREAILAHAWEMAHAKSPCKAHEQIKAWFAQRAAP